MFVCVQNIFKRTLTSLSYGTLKSFLFYYYSLYNKSKIDQTYIIELVFCCCCCCCHQRKKKEKFQILFHNDNDDDGYDEKKIWTFNFSKKKIYAQLRNSSKQKITFKEFFLSEFLINVKKKFHSIIKKKKTFLTYLRWFVVVSTTIE